MALEINETSLEKDFIDNMSGRQFVCVRATFNPDFSHSNVNRNVANKWQGFFKGLREQVAQNGPLESLLAGNSEWLGLREPVAQNGWGLREPVALNGHSELPLYADFAVPKKNLAIWKLGEMLPRLTQITDKSPYSLTVGDIRGIKQLVWFSCALWNVGG